MQQIQAVADGAVVTWGQPELAGDSRVVQDLLKNVHQIQADSGAFAAILADEAVVMWGDDQSGGGSSAVQDQLRNVQQIHASCSGFAAILGDGSVVIWAEGGNRVLPAEKISADPSQ